MPRASHRNAVPLSREPTQPYRPPRKPGGLLARLTEWLLPFRERRHAVRTCRAMLAVYRRVTAEQPGLDEHEVHRRIVMQHLGLDAASADRLLEQAAESFASWPETRELTLCDIVHYVAFDQFTAKAQAGGWMRADIAVAIRAEIPRELGLAHPVR
jgi:hypothetical protein